VFPIASARLNCKQFSKDEVMGKGTLRTAPESEVEGIHIDDLYE